LEIKVHGRDIENALKKLKRKLEREGLFREIKKRRFYQKPSVKKKMKQIEARRKKIKALKFKR
jgi:small subunit ribosomal protein S21